MKESKRVQQALKIIQELKKSFEFFCNDETFRQFNRDLSKVEDLLKELSIDQKTQNARLAKRLKSIWNSEEEQ